MLCAYNGFLYLKNGAVYECTKNNVKVCKMKIFYNFDSALNDPAKVEEHMTS